MPPSFLRKVLIDESWLTRAAVRFLACPGPIAMLLLVRDEIDIIESNVSFHLHFGIERFVITDNRSTDGTRDILAAFERRLPNFIVLDDPTPAYRQVDFVSRMIQVAKREFRPRWIISADADEFWYPVSGRYDTELDGRKNILNCHWHNYLPRSGVPWQRFSDVGDMLGYNGRMSKVFCLARGLVGMYQGNHDSRSIPRLVSKSDNIRVYHYPVRSYEQFERKVVQGYRAAAGVPAMPSTWAWHWRESYRAWEEGRLRALYEQFSALPGSCKDNTMSDLLAKTGGG